MRLAAVGVAISAGPRRWGDQAWGLALATPLKNSPTSLPALADALALYLEAQKKK